MNSFSLIKNRRVTLGLCLALVLMIWFVFGQTLTFDFVNYDDQAYVTENSLVLGGITRAGVQRVFLSNYSFYHPLTTLSHMLDVQMYGLNPSGFHLTNVVLHTASAILLFLVLRSMTGSLWRSALVAAVFAIHPLRAESVTWITERKDCLSGFFFMLTLSAYHRYVKGQQSKVKSLKSVNSFSKSSIKNHQLSILSAWRSGSYWLIFLCMAACMLSKATVVTLPFVLLLLDFWPLGRWSDGKLECWKNGGGGWLTAKDRREREGRVSVSLACSNAWKILTAKTQREEKEDWAFAAKERKKEPQQPKTINQQLYFFVLEKIPFFLLSAAMAVVMVLSSGESMHSLDGSPFMLRVANAVVSYVTYIFQFFVPINLAVIYPYPTDSIPFWKSGGSILLLGGITLFLVRRVLSSHIPHSTAHNSPSAALAAGWLWFLGMLLPMIGIVQAGPQAHADRYTYLSQIGLSIMLVWGVGELFASPRVRRGLVFSFSLFGLLMLMMTARMQVHHWRNSLSLWSHVLTVKPSLIAYNNMGLVLVEQGRVDAGITYYEKALALNPCDAISHNNLGIAFKKKGMLDEAIEHYKKAIDGNSELAEAYSNLAGAFSEKGDLSEGVHWYQQALNLKPFSAILHKNMAVVLVRFGETDEAVRHFGTAVEIDPYMLDASNGLAKLLAQRGEVSSAVLCLQQALRRHPMDTTLHCNLGLLFEAQGLSDLAIEQYGKALRLPPGSPQAQARRDALILRASTMEQDVSKP